jgi:hypothetical protein
VALGGGPPWGAARTWTAREALVIFLAPDASAENPSNRLKMVGWYQNAKVLRFWQDDPTGQRWTLGSDGEDKKALYNVTARVEGAVLLPTHRRTQSIPRGENGIGRANVRYIYDDQEILAMASWMKDVLDYVDSYNGENLLADPLAEVEQIAEEELEKAAGFESNPKIPRAIETRAMDVAEQDYTRKHFSVTHKHAFESYDLLCKKDGFEIRVEVKGTRSNGSVVVLTENEVKMAIDPTFKMELCVVHSIRLSGEKATGGILERYEHWNPKAHNLRPISYQCRLLKKLAITR